jgi:hypothetical protein
MTGARYKHKRPILSLYYAFKSLVILAIRFIQISRDSIEDYETQYEIASSYLCIQKPSALNEWSLLNSQFFRSGYPDDI